MPQKLRDEMERDPFYRRCCITGEGRVTSNIHDPERIEWHHNLIYAGKQVNEKWCILPIKKEVHRKMSKEIKEICDWIMLNRATDDELAKYSSIALDLREKKTLLNKKRGVWDQKHQKYTQHGKDM